MSKVAVTGGISCGKSSVCQFLKELGAHVISADVIVHDLLSQSDPIQRAVIDLLGEEIVVDGRIDRQKVASVVFGNRQLLDALEQIIHPAVRAAIRTQAEAANPAQLFVAEVPLLYEAQMEEDFDLVVAVISDQQKCAQRTAGHQHDLQERTMRQLSNEEKAAKADYTINNNGTLEELREQTRRLYGQLVEDRPFNEQR